MASVLVSALLATPESFEVELYLFDRFNRRTAQDLLDLFTARIIETLGVEASRTEGGYILEEPPIDGVPYDPEKGGPIGNIANGSSDMWLYDAVTNLDERCHGTYQVGQQKSAQ